jgi:TolB-like protein
MRDRRHRDHQHLIRTLARKGFRFIGAVREEHEPTPAQGSKPAVEYVNPSLIFPDRPSIAVLPFDNMSGDPEQDCFADGVAEEIITALSRCSGLFVAARNSSFTYKGKAVDVRHVGRELGVRYVLEGIVRRGGDRLRFTGQLIDATSGGHIWSERFEGDVGNVLELQDRFAEAVVAAIEPKLQLAEIEQLNRQPPSMPHPYRLLLRAQQCEYKFGRDSHAAALQYLHQALAIDPDYAPAMALAAHCYAVRRVQGWMKDSDDEVRHGLRLASQAVEFSKDDANVLWMAAYAVLRLQMDLPQARELINYSLDINPNSAIATAIAGEIESDAGNTGKALQLLFRAVRLSPRDPRSWFTTLGLSWTYLVDGQFDQAIAAAQKILNQNPNCSYALRFLASGLAQQGRVDEAAGVARRTLSIEPVTLTKLRSRLMFIDDGVWRDYAAGLRLAGLSE